MSTTANFAPSKAFLLARAIVARKLGITTALMGNSSDEAIVAAMTPAEQIRLTDGVSQFIVEHPAQFSADQVETATRWTNGASYGKPLADTSLGAAFEEFGTEFKANVAEASKITLNFGIGILLTAIVGFAAWKYFTRPQS